MALCSWIVRSVDMKEKQISSKLKYECFFMKLFEDEVLLPNQKQVKEFISNMTEQAQCYQSQKMVKSFL